MRVQAVLAYDGTDYHGFQRQSLDREPSIQGRLEQALAAIGQEGVTVIGSGRTDAGVHASGQVVAFDVNWPHGRPALQRALNASLPPTIAVLHLEWTRPDFHPRYDALRREYVYTIYNAPVRHPLYSRFSWHVPGELDVEHMERACQALLGERDFATFGQPTGHRPGESTIRRVYQAGCWRAGWSWPPASVETSGRECVYIRVEASGFLYHMMRSLVATLVCVGQGKLDPASVAELIASRDRNRVRFVAPAQGLCLTQVVFNHECH
ncbi:MAG: tRNA pseudouridine(38-40) synthase TruA [Thermoflexales bacterium]|nr:tRNA pseudouridine(38-40) synthase TruA [Thermoflexales bacterium]